jgi:hypothetical protein
MLELVFGHHFELLQPAALPRCDKLLLVQVRVHTICMEEDKRFENKSWRDHN